MSVQIIKGMDGRDEYVLLPVRVYNALRDQIEEQLSGLEVEPDREEDCNRFNPADFVQNPVALARMQAGVKQVELAKRMKAPQAYISKLEHSDTVSKPALKRVQGNLKTPDPQVIKPEAINLSEVPYDQIIKPKISLVEFIRKSPLADSDLDLIRDKSATREDVEL